MSANNLGYTQGQARRHFTTITNPTTGEVFKFLGRSDLCIRSTSTRTVKLESQDPGIEITCFSTSGTLTLQTAAGVAITTVASGEAVRLLSTAAGTWIFARLGASGDTVNASDVSYPDTDSHTGATNVNTALYYLATNLGPLSQTSTTYNNTDATGTLTAAAVYSGIINRTGETSAFTDTVPTAASLVAIAAAGGATINWLLYYRNTVAFTATLATDGTTTVTGGVVPPNSVGVFFVETDGASAASMTSIGNIPFNSAPLSAVTTANNTDGTLTIPAATITGGYINRTGETTAFTDTTDTAANIIAAMPSADIGDGFELTYKNTLAFTGTLVGGTGVNSGATVAVIPPLSTGRIHVKYTSAGVVTMTLLSTVPISQLPAWQFNTTSAASGLVAAGSVLAGAHEVFYQVTTDGAMAITTSSAADMFAAIPNCTIGYKYLLTIINRGDNTITLTGGTNVTIAENTIATLVAQTYAVELTSATAATWTKVRTGSTPT
jgi:hypothetical protein